MLRMLKNVMQVISLLAIAAGVIYYFCFEKNLTFLLIAAGGGLVLFILFTIIKADRLTEKEKKRGLLWKDRERNKLGLPWTLTVYTMDQDRLYRKHGLLNTREDEVRLYRIVDMTMSRTIWQKLIGLGSLHCESTDTALKSFNIKNIRHCPTVKQMTSKLIDESRLRNKVFSTESINAGMNGPGPHPAGLEGMEDPIPMEDVNGNGIPDRFE